MHARSKHPDAALLFIIHQVTQSSIVKVIKNIHYNMVQYIRG